MLESMKNSNLVQEAVGEIFRRCPSLCGFTVQEMRGGEPGEVVFADVAVQPWAGHRPPQELLSEIASALLELAEEEPETKAFIAGRTFAPALH